MKRLITVLALAMLAIAAHAHDGHTSLRTLCEYYQGSYHDQWERTNPNFSWDASYHHTGDYTVAQVCAQWMLDDGARLPGVEYYEGGLTSEPAQHLVVDRVGYVIDQCGIDRSVRAAIAIAESKCPSTTYRYSNYERLYYTERVVYNCPTYDEDSRGLASHGYRVTVSFSVDCHYEWYP